MRLRSFGKRRERIPVLVHNLVGDLHCLLKVRIVGHRLKPTSGQLGDVQFLPPLEIESLHQKVDQLREKEVMMLTQAVSDLTALLMKDREAAN